MTPPLPIAALSASGTAWSPLLWLALLAASLLAALFFRSLGRRDRPAHPDAAEPFVSGNRLDNPEDAHFAGSHLYSGFIDALRAYYARVLPWHSGRLTDYFLALLLFLAVLILLFRLAP